MPKIIGNAVVLDEDEVKSICKVNKIIDAFFDLHKQLRELSDKELTMLYKSLELTKKEMISNARIH